MGTLNTWKRLLQVLLVGAALAGVLMIQASGPGGGVLTRPYDSR